MADQQTETDNGRQRFLEAKARYNAMNQASHKNKESVEGDSTKSGDDLVNIIDLLNKQQTRMSLPKHPNVSPKKMNFGNDNIPIPIPVRPIEPEAIMNQERTNALLNKMNFGNDNIPIPIPVRPIEPEAIMNQEHTNALLNKLQKTVIATSLPNPVKIDDENLAHETTLQTVVEVLREIWTGIQDFSKQLYDRFVQVFGSFENSMIDSEQQIEKSQGLFKSMFSKLTGYLQNMDPGVHSLALIFAKVTKPLIDRASKTVSYLKGIYEIQKSNSLWVLQNASNTTRARAEVEEDAKPQWFESFLSKDSTIGKLFTGIANVFDAFFLIGEMAENSLNKKSGGNVLKYLSNAGVAASMLGRFLAVFGGIAGFVATAVGSVAFASLYAMFKNPEQMYRMFEAFGSFFSKVVVPVFEWISKEIIPPLTIVFAALMVAADYLLETVGYWVNERLIYLIGTALPEVLKVVGHTIDAMFQGVKELVLRILGIFGVGEYGEEGILKNLMMAWVGIADAMLNAISVGLTAIVNALGAGDFFGLQEGEGIYDRLKRFLLIDVPIFVIKQIDNLIELLKELNPIPTIKKKLEQFTDAIVSLIPSWQDVKKWVADTIPSWVNDDIRQWMMEKLSVDQPTTTQQTVPTMRDSRADYDAAVSTWDKFKANMGNMFSFAPSTVNNTTNVAGGGGGGGGWGGRGGIGADSTRPRRDRIDDLIIRANPY